MSLVLAVAQIFLLLITGVAFLLVRFYHRGSREELASLRSKVIELKTEVDRLTPPDGRFRLEWMRSDLPEQQFKDVVSYLAERDLSKISWSAEWASIDRNLDIRNIYVHSSDKQEAMLFKLTFGGAL